MLRASKTWPAEYDVISQRIQEIAREFSVSVRDVLLQLALARGDVHLLGRNRGSRIPDMAVKCGLVRFPALCRACEGLARDLQDLDGVDYPEHYWPGTVD